MSPFTFVAGFFRNQAPESSTRLVGILACIAGLALAAVLIWAVALAPVSEHREITWTDIVVVASVFAYSCTALGLRSPFPTELFAPKGTTIAATTETTKVEQTATAEVKTS